MRTSLALKLNDFSDKNLTFRFSVDKIGTFIPC